MPYTKIINIHCLKTYNVNGKDSVTVNLIDELIDKPNIFTFDADDMEANNIREVNGGLEWTGQGVMLKLHLKEPSLNLGSGYIRVDSINKGELKRTFNNKNKDYEYEVSYEVTDH